MKILVLCNSDSLAFPTLNTLGNLGLLVSVGLLESSEKELKPALCQMGLNIELLILTRQHWKETLKTEIKSKSIDTVWVLTFPWRIPNSLLTLPKKGFVNFHFGILPKYKGIDPVFWQLKNREPHGGLTIHKMTDSIDEGPVLLQELVSIIPGETYGFHCSRLGVAAAESVEKVKAIQLNPEQENITVDAQKNLGYGKPKEEDLTINWKIQTAEEIEALVNASNPKYGGVKTIINALEIYILEVTPVTLDGRVDAVPGQIVHADAIYGVVVFCKGGGSIRITVVRAKEGYLSGVRLFNLGFGMGHIFG